MTTSVPENMSPELPPELTPHPIPVGFSIATHPSGYVILQFVDATGQRFVFLDKDTAKAFQEQFTRAVGAAASGLYVP